MNKETIKTLDYPTYKRFYCADGSTEIESNDKSDDDSEPMSQNDILKIING
jgi:hypothetical protein